MRVGSRPARGVVVDVPTQARRVAADRTGDADVVVDLVSGDRTIDLRDRRPAEPQPLDSPGDVLARIHRAFPAKRPASRYERRKRLLDIVLASTLLLAAMPVIAVLAVVIRLDSRGPVVFSQPRIGRGGRLFQFKKFRTMHVDARDRFPELYQYRYSPDELDDLRFKTAVDPRHTRVGHWLRRTSFDELPNLYNVIRGDMSLVGPRPEIPDMLPYYEPEELVKFSVMPGLTGYSQVRGRNVLRFKETIANDLEYVRDRKLSVDLAVLVRTPVVVVKMLGAL
jgi:lipopolysaccharide/colanic/teichoic acid biosynthesis glycosyltransferase